MTKWVVLSFVMVVGLSGCMVSKTQYEATVADMEAAKAELEKSRMHQEALEEQIRNLKNVNEKFSADLEMATAEVQRVKEGRKNEQTLLETREREIDQEKVQLVGKLRVLAEQYQKVKTQNRALKDTVIRYQKELKDSRVSGDSGMTGTDSKAMDPMSASVPKSSLKSSETSMTMTKPAAPKIVTPPSLPKIGGDVVNINKASVSDLVLSLGLSREIAEDVVSNRPYRLRGELVAKNVIPKSTFDEIKDRITAAP
ncbi:MAG: helix-hairpin-helix domain-containing protein [Nitrospirales bacterium]|nr:helix-hairpin-helix domain-containing protein [Nitrospirales bacterium]